MDRQPRFVVLRHDVGANRKRPHWGRDRPSNAGPSTTAADGSHLDWMFEMGGVLRTWATAPIADFDHSFDLPCDPLSDHRLAYLTYEGDIGRNRGTVTRILAGCYRRLECREDQFAVCLMWQRGEPREANAFFYRSLRDDRSRVDESRESLWRLRFSPGRNETKR